MPGHLCRVMLVIASGAGAPPSGCHMRAGRTAARDDGARAQACFLTSVLVVERRGREGTWSLPPGTVRKLLPWQRACSVASEQRRPVRLHSAGSATTVNPLDLTGFGLLAWAS